MKKILLLICLCLLAPGLVSAERRAYQKDTFRGGRGSLSLTPGELGATAWWDASLSTITSSDGLATGVTDLSGNGYNLATMEDFEPYLGRADGRENRFYYSDDISNDAWDYALGTTLAGNLMSETTDTSSHFHGQTNIYAPAGSYRLRVKVRPNGRNNARFQLEMGGAEINYATMDVTTGSVYASSGFTNITSTADGSDYIVSMEMTTTYSTAEFRLFLCNDAFATSYAGDIAKGMYLQWANLADSKASLEHITTTDARIYRGISGFPAFIADDLKGLFTEAAAVSQPWSVIFVGEIFEIPSGEDTALLLTDMSERGLWLDADGYYLSTGTNIMAGTPSSGSHIAIGVAGVEVAEDNYGYLYLNGALIGSGEAGSYALSGAGFRTLGRTAAAAIIPKALTASEVVSITTYFKRRWRF